MNAVKTMHTKNSLHLSDLCFSWGKKEIFSHLDLDLIAGDRVVIVGENGQGKSTLIKILNREISSKDFEGQLRTPYSIGYLPQNLENLFKGTVLEYLIEASGHPELMASRKQTPTLSPEQLEEEFNLHEGYLYWEHLSGLGLDSIPLHKSVQTMSGGEKTKLVMAGLAFSRPDLLLLDEPTNHLDEKGLNWLEKFLIRYSGAVVMITHDRTLIGKTVNRISEICPNTKKLVHFRGGYEQYLKEQEKLLERRRLQHIQQTKELKKLSQQFKLMNSNKSQSHKRKCDNDKLSHNFRGQGAQNSDKRQRNSLKSKIDSIKNNRVDVPKERTSIKANLEDCKIKHNLEISVQNLSKTFDTSPVFKDIGFTLYEGDRLVIKGSNGTGKTTLLKILANIIKPNTGTVSFSPGVTFGFLDQEQETLDLSKSPLELLSQNSSVPFTAEEIGRELLKWGIWDRSSISVPLKNMSIGCRRKVQLAQLSLNKINTLLLDEPTNHIDFQSLEQIEDIFMNFPGIIIAVSHDRTFIQKIATQTLTLGTN